MLRKIPSLNLEGLNTLALSNAAENIVTHVSCMIQRLY